MNDVLPDVSITDCAVDLGSLDWVGMKGIDLPLVIEETGYRNTLAAPADVSGNLPAANINGIHVSRLYPSLNIRS